MDCEWSVCFGLQSCTGSAPTHAGTAPFARTICCMSRVTCTLMGRGRPCVRSADSSATTGAEAASAARTSSLTRSHDVDADVGDELRARRISGAIRCSFI